MSLADVVECDLILQHISCFLSLKEHIQLSRCNRSLHARVVFRHVKAVDLIPPATPPKQPDDESQEEGETKSLDEVLSAVPWTCQVISLDLSFCFDLTQQQYQHIASLCPNLQRLATNNVVTRAKQRDFGVVFDVFFTEHILISHFSTNVHPRWTQFPPTLTHFTYEAFQASVPVGVLNPSSSEDPLALQHLSLWTSVYKTRWENRFNFDAEGLVALVSRCPGLEYLDVSGWERLDGVAKALAEHCPKLNTLIARRSAFSLQELDDLTGRLQHLDLRCCAAVPAAEAHQFVGPTDPDVFFEQLEDSIGMIASRPDVTKDIYTHAEWDNTSAFPEWIQKLLSVIGKYQFRWQFSDTVGRPNDVQSLGGHLYINVSDKKETTQWMFSPGSENMLLYGGMDSHVAEGSGYLVHNPTDDTWYVNWFTTSSLPLWHHKMMTVEEYFVQGAKRGFSWYWPCFTENLWILARLHRTPDVPPHMWASCMRCNKWRRMPVGTLEANIPDNWECSMNVDKERNQCAASEEPQSSEEEEPLEIGDEVTADWQNKGRHYPGSIIDICRDSQTYTIHYHEDDFEESGVSADRIKFVAKGDAAQPLKKKKEAAKKTPSKKSRKARAQPKSRTAKITNFFAHK